MTAEGSEDTLVCVRAEIDFLLEDWLECFGGPALLGRRGGRVEWVEGPIINGLAAHVHRLGRAVRRLDEADMLIEAVPLIRTMLEQSWTAVWVAQNPQGARAFANESTRNKTNTRNYLDRRMAELPGVGPLDEPRADLPTTASDSQARNFEQLCDDLEGGARVYLHYRLMSNFVHPDVSLVDQYTRLDAGAKWTSLDTPRPLLDPYAWLFFAAASLVWAGSAVNNLDPSRKRRSQLRAAARRLNIDASPALTWTARRRMMEKNRPHTSSS